ncbi:MULTISPECIES: phage tail protein [Lysinibacillus]|uniref:phage tail protein n=1 Tax=Lysinibacillus TaxID=400634 RepID=UPI002584A0D2|nr:MULTISPECIES: tail fiber protein [Lysinibacillus]
MDPYIGEIRLFAGGFVPAGWALCDGSIYLIQQYQALYTVIGNQFGGDLKKGTFALPDFKGRIPMHQGTGEGLTPRTFAEKGGDATVTLNELQMPSHNHAVNCQKTVNQNQINPVNAVWASSPAPPPPPPPLPAPSAPSIYSNTENALMSLNAISTNGGGRPHNNMQPYLSLRFIISLEGVYPIKQD